MVRFIMTNVIEVLTDSLRYIVLMLVLLWLVSIAISAGESHWQHREHALPESSRDPAMDRSPSRDLLPSG
jgi:hypothetical protein